MIAVITNKISLNDSRFTIATQQITSMDSQIFPDIPRYSQIFPDIPRYSQIFSDIPRYSQIFSDIPRIYPLSMAILKPSSTSTWLLRCVPDSRLSSPQLEALITKLCRSWSMDKETGERVPWHRQSMFDLERKSSKSGWLESLIKLMFDLENRLISESDLSLNQSIYSRCFGKVAESALCEETDFRRNRLRMVSFCWALVLYTASFGLALASIIELGESQVSEACSEIVPWQKKHDVMVRRSDLDEKYVVLQKESHGNPW